jgi:hypothetical protein
MNYNDRFQAAIIKTNELNLPITPIKFGNPLSDDFIRNIVGFGIEMLNRMGLTDSKKLASKCVPVNFYLNKLLESELGIKSYVTIGDRYWNENDIYCEMSYEKIVSELDKPNIQETIDAHVWLTLTDGTVIDFTSEAHIDVLEGRGCFPSTECFQVIKLNENVEKGFHRPFLVGDEFLYKTGCIQL